MEEWFISKERKIMCGVELEMVLFDYNTKEPVRDHRRIDGILSKLPRQIFKDYYPHQLEIRTMPHSNPDEVINEARDLYKIASKEFMKKNIYVIPVPAISNDNSMYCGMHLHISFDKDKNIKDYWKRAMGMYPFILSLAGHTKNLELSKLETSNRISMSHHIGIPYLDQLEFLDLTAPNHKFKDIILSPAITSETNRSRLLKPNTIEIRMLDTPSLFTFFEFMVRYVMAIASKIRDDSPMIKMIRSDYNLIKGRLELSRTLTAQQRYGVNKVFRMLNADVCEDVCKYMGINFPRETQFEYRERLGLSANINGFLTMALKGGWL